MKVLQVLPALNGGGVERGTLEIADALVSAGHESWVLSAGGRLVEMLEAAGSQHKTWDIGKKSLLNVLQVRKVRAWLQQQQFDIVHVRSRMPAWVVYLAWRKMPPETRPRLVSTVHGLHSVSAYSEIAACGEKVIAVSQHVKRYIITNYPKVSAEKIELIYRGIDPAEFNPELKPTPQWLEQWQQEYPQLNDQFVICLPGRLTRLKGHEELFKILQALNQKGLKAYALVVGGEDPKRQAYAQGLYQQVKDLGIEQQLIFTGSRQDIANIYSISHVILSLSTKPEAFGRTILEALSMGRPVLAYDHGGAAEILDELYPEGKVLLLDMNTMVEKILAIHQGALEQVKPNQTFILQRMQQQTLSLYQRLRESPR